MRDALKKIRWAAFEIAFLAARGLALALYPVRAVWSLLSGRTRSLWSGAPILTMPIKCRAVTRSMGSPNACTDCDAPRRYCSCDEKAAADNTRKLSSLSRAVFSMGDMIEEMALGKPVMCFIRKPEDDLLYPGECPIINTHVLTLKEDIRRLVAERGSLNAIGRRGRGYVEKHLDNLAP